MKITNLADIKYLDTACSDSIGPPLAQTQMIPSSTHCYTPLRIKLRPLEWKGKMQQEFRYLQGKAKAIEMERADATRN